MVCPTLGLQASFCRTDGNTRTNNADADADHGDVLTYNFPPAKPADAEQDGYEGLLGHIRGFRRPGLRHRESEIAGAVASLRAGTAHALRGDTGLPFTAAGPSKSKGGKGGEDEAAAAAAAQAHLERLMARLDTSQFVMAGHSFGAATVQ